MAAAGSPEVLLHLAAWCQLGVLTRYYLGRLLGGACEAWGACVTSNSDTRSGGALFIDAPSNVLGSLFMGLLATSDALKAAFSGGGGGGGSAVVGDCVGSRPLPALPARSPLQSHAALLVGLRTGYCGSLTTFASWMLQMVEMGVRGQWVEAFSGCFVGTLLAIASLTMGQHLALLAADLTRASARAEDQAAVLPHGGGGSGAEGGASSSSGSGKSPSNGAGAPAGDGAAARNAATGATAAAVTKIRVEVEEDSGGNGRRRRPLAHYAANALAAVSLCTLSAASLALIVSRRGRDAEAVLWFAILLGPFGCWLRWLLARLNGKLGPAPAWSWFPAGTFAANMLACVLDYAVQAGAARHSSAGGSYSLDGGAAALPLGRRPLRPVELAVLSGVITGFGGSLSTVSTWVVEIQQQLVLGVPRRHIFRGWGYCLLSLGLAFSLGLLIYGVPMWTTD